MIPARTQAHACVTRPIPVGLALTPVRRRQGEEEVRAMYRRAGRADIGYTIVRPGGLTNGPASPVSALELRCALARLGPPGARPSPRAGQKGAAADI